MQKILITGATGFIGQHLLPALLKNDSFLPQVVLRNPEKESSYSGIPIFINSLDENSNWQDALSECDTVIHLAARVHVMKEKAADPLAEFRKTNTQGTLNLAQQAVKAGVRRFIYLSTAKVNGENSSHNPFCADDKPNPGDPYAISKFEAECGLRALAESSSMEVVIIRPPLVYGPGVKGNFKTMMAVLRKGIPLPFGRITNKRSLVAIDNLVSLIKTCINHPNAANQVFLVSDGEDLSTTELLRKMSIAMNKSVWLLPIPQGMLACFAKLLGQGAVFQRLCGSLQLDIRKTCQLLNWQPEALLLDSLKITVDKAEALS